MIAIQQPSAGSLLPIPLLFPINEVSAARFGRRTPDPHDRPAALPSMIHGDNRRGAVVEMATLREILEGAQSEEQEELKLRALMKRTEEEYLQRTSLGFNQKSDKKNDASQKENISHRLLKSFEEINKNIDSPFLFCIKKEFGDSDLTPFIALYVFGTPKYAEELAEYTYQRVINKKTPAANSPESKRFRALHNKLENDIREKLLSGELTATAVDNGYNSLGEREEISKESWNLYDINGFPLFWHLPSLGKINPNWTDILISKNSNTFMAECNTKPSSKRNTGGRPSKHDWAYIAGIMVRYILDNGEPNPNERGSQAQAVEYLFNRLEEDGRPLPSESDAKAFVRACSENTTEMKQRPPKAEN
ncbi:hypothetical protein [Acetobacter persici]|uniref:hypothetical protein n=1 Tax=Acetobacter persici TaxID=1076596 RepID=UPI0020136CB0|nr:hypothetical protein [Acetobacter persici]